MNIKKLIPYLAFCSLFLLLSTFLGYFLAASAPELSNLVMSQMQEKFGPLKDANPLKIFGYIFLNNTLIDLGMVLTFFLFGLSAVGILLTNGLLIGIVLQGLQGQQSALEMVTLLAPHGILEIPAFIVAASVSLWLSIQFIKMIFTKEAFKPKFIWALKIFFYVVLPLNLLAAFVETYITPLIYSLSFPS